MTQAVFADLEIRIFPRQEEGYPVEIRLDGQQEFPRGYLHADILSWIPSGNSLTDGKNLFNFLFDDKSLYRAWHHAVGQCPHRCIRLWVDTDAPELHAVPWELLHDGETFLAVNAATPMSRYLPGVTVWGRPVLQGSLRVLAIIANPTDLADYGLVSLDVEQERSVLDVAFAALPLNRCHLDFLDAPVTLARLEDRLRAGYHILHFVGHGAFNQRQKQAYLYLQDAQGNTEIVTSNAFVEMLKHLDQRPHLVFLAACQTAKRDTADAFVGFCPELVRADIPSVVAMQGDIAIPTAQTLSHTFYQQLVRHGKADLALNEARSTLLTTQRSDAAMPVLFMRLKDGQLWAPPERHDFYQHIPLPLHYIARPDVLAPIRAALLEDPTGLALTSAIKMNALHGMGGIGKTVIARALCDDPDIQAAFPDGILWATLGQTPNLTVLLREWVETLGSLISESAPTPAQLKNHLIRLLEQRACLLIVDDVWQRTHAEAFQVGGASCRLLLTTRDAEIPHALGATLQSVDVLPEAQAVALLELWAEGDLNDTALNLKQCIVARLGCLPLALKLAGAQLRDETPEAWLQAFEIKDLEASRVESLHDSLVMTFAHSLGQLPPQDRQCYISLAIFREDEPVPAIAIAKLWEAQSELSRRKVISLLKDLASRALLQITETPDELNISLHDLLRDFIAAELGKAGALSAHRALLDIYCVTQPGVGWHTVPDDGYVYAHLAYHLDAIGDYEALKTLFADDAWMHMRVEADDYVYDGYLADLSIAWVRAQAVAVSLETEMPLSLAMADCVHYALIHASVNALSSNYEPELVARAVETGLWSPARGASVARLVVEVEKQVEMVIALLRTGCMPNTLCADMQRLGLAAAHAIGDEKNRARVLAALAPQLTGTLLGEALAAARAIKDEKDRARVLVTLAPQLTGTLLADGLAAAHTIVTKEWQADVLKALAPQLTGDLLGEALAAARAMWPEVGSQASVLVALAPQLTGNWLMEALAIANMFWDETKRAEALVALALQFTGTARTQILTDILTTIRTFDWEKGRVEVLKILAPQLTEELLKECLAITRTIENETDRAEVLVALASQLTKNLLMEALAIARTIEDRRRRAEFLVTLPPQLTEDWLTEAITVAHGTNNESDRAEVLMTFAPRLTGNWSMEALALARAIEDKPSRTQVLVALAPQLPETFRIQALTEGLVAAREIEPEWYRAEILAMLAPQLTGELLAEGLAAACGLESDWSRAQVLAALAPQLTGELLAEGLTAARAIADEESRTQVLAALTPQLRGNLLKERLAEARAIKDEKYRAWVLTKLAPHLTGVTRIRTSTEIVTVAHSIMDEWGWEWILNMLALHLTDVTWTRVLTVAIAMARTIKNETNRAKVLVALAPRLTGDLLMEALAMARTIENETNRAEVLMAFAPRLTGNWSMEALALARAIENKPSRTQALVALAPQLPETFRIQALTEGLVAARLIRSEEDRVEVLMALVPQLRGDLLKEGLAAARAIEGEWGRTQVLAMLAPQLRGDLLEEGLAAARAIDDEKYRAQVLAALAPQFTGNLLKKRLIATRFIKSEENRAQVLAALAPQLTGDLLKEGLAAAWAIKEEESRVKVLVALTPQLTGELLKEGLTAARLIRDKWYKVKALVALASRLTGESRVQVLTEGLETAYMLWSEEDRAKVLVALVPQLTGNLLKEAFARARTIEDSWYRAQALATLAPQLTGAFRIQALAEGLVAARTIGDGKSQAEALSMLIPQLTGELLTEGLEAASSISDEEKRADFLVELAPYFTNELLTKNLTMVCAIENEEYRVKVLAALALSAHISGHMLGYIRQALLCCLWDLKRCKRAELLNLLVDSDLAFLRALGMSQTGYNQIAQSVTAICTQWEWL